MQTLTHRRPWARLALAIAGMALNAFATNYFIVPAGLYSGGLMGLCQLARTLVLEWTPLQTGSFDFAGLLYLLANLPLFFLGYRSLGKLFVRNTVICTLALSLFLSVLPVPVLPVIEDRLTSCLLGGILSGAGAGLGLTCGCSSGGLEVLGLYLAKKNAGFTVGRFSLYFNMALYGLCLALFNAETAIYSIIYATFQSMVVDKVHQQNINVQVLIFTRQGAEELESYIIEHLGRGVTSWEGEGSFTHRGIHILCTVLSKYEINDLRQGIHTIDPKAFFIVQEGVSVGGNFLKRLS